MLVSGLIIAIALGLVEATPLQNLNRRAGYAVKESITLPRGWRHVGDVSGNEDMVFSIGLKQSAFEKLEQQLYEVSDPDHENYGNHLTSEQVHSLVKPTEETLEAVHSWLEMNGISRERYGYSPSKDWVNVRLSIADAEALLDAKFGRYQHADGTDVIRTLEYSIPTALDGHIDTIQPTNSFLRAKPNHFDHIRVNDHKIVSSSVDITAEPAKTDGSVLAACGNGTRVTPNCLRTLYGTIDYKVQCAENNRVGINNFLGELNNRSDTKIFLSTYRKDIDAKAASQSFKQISIAGGTVQQSPNNASQLDAGTGLEGNLDIETVLGISYPTRVTAYSTGGSPPFIPDLRTTDNTNEPYLTWVQYMAGVKDKDLPYVISTSYGDDEQTVPISYAKRVCNDFAHLGARGVTLLFASGDAGVGPVASQCRSNDGKNTFKFLPSFPASCPFVTAVGGTKIGDATNTKQPEVAARDVFSSGAVYTSGAGFSNYFKKPWYQTNTISNYIKSIGATNKGLYNTSGRAYPEISANGQRYITVWNGTEVILDGTSASTPAVAGIFALVNDALIAKGKKKLGFLNVWLYKKGYKAFRDVTEGGSDGCGTTGFRAQPGWDAVTGFGTPIFSKLIDQASCKE